MLFSIALIVVVVLLAVAVWPIKNRELAQLQSDQLRQASPVAFLTPEPVSSARQTTLRQQQLDEEATAVASEYQRRADAVWLEEVRTKASKLLGNATAGTKAKAE